MWGLVDSRIDLTGSDYTSPLNGAETNDMAPRSEMSLAANDAAIARLI